MAKTTELVALTKIVHGNEDGERIEIEEGDTVSDKLDKETIETLKGVGSIGEPAMTQSARDQEKEDLLAQIEKLQRDLAEANKPPEPVKPAVTKPAGGQA